MNQPELPLARSFRAFSSWVALAVTTVGFSVLLGWLLDVHWLKSVLPGLVTMKANTALGLILAAVALWLLRAEHGNRSERRLGQLCAFVVLLLGLLTFSQYLFGWDFGIDQLLFRETPEAIRTSSLGRMAPQTALGFLLVASALLLLDVETRSHHRPAQALALAVALASFFALCGYAYGVSAFYGFASYTHIALHTAVSFGLLSLGVLCARPGRGPMAFVSSNQLGGLIVRRLLPAAVGIPAILGWLRLEGEQAGLYGTEFGITLSVVSSTILLALVIWWNARWLERVDDERRRAEQELDRFFNLSLDLLCIAGFDGHFKRLNPAWEKTLGFTEVELLARPYLEFVHPDDRQVTQAEASKIAAGADTISFENRYRCKDGSYRWLLWKSTPVPDRQLVYASARDITERKKAEQALRRLAAIVESTDDAVVGKTLDGTIISWNPGAEVLYGYPADEVIGRPFSLLVPSDRPDEMSVILDRIRRGERVVHYETVRRRKDASLASISLTVSPLKDGAGRIVGASSIARDITARKQDEARLQQLNAELEATNKELEAFTYSVSHDLRAPLRHVDGFSRILVEEFGPQLDPTARRYLERMQKGVRNMATLVDDLLQLARISRQEVRRQVAGLGLLVAEVVADLEPETDGRQIEWRIGQLPFADCDPALMKQVFANLLSNAVKYTRPRQQAVIEVGTLNQNGQSAVFVRDNGVGFSMKYADKLFGVFQRLHRAEDFEGTGVGLATVQRIVHKHGGRVWAEAELDKGATFYFTLGAEANPEATPHITSGGVPWQQPTAK